MPEQPNDDRELEHEVRDAMDGMASEAAPPPSAPPGVLSAAKRRLARNSAALVVALVLIAGGVAAGLQFTNRDSTSDPIGTTTGPPSVAPTASPASPEPTPSPVESGGTPTPSPTDAEPSPTETVPSGAGGTGTGPLPVKLFLDGRIWRYVNGTKGLAGIPVGSIPEPTAAQPPVATPYGIVVLGGTPGLAGNLWLMQPNGDRELIDSNVSGFAVSDDGTRVTYARLGPGNFHALLIELHLDETDVLRGSLDVDNFVRVIGYAGDVVVLETGDGAAASAATWTPGALGIVPVDGFGSAVGTDPTSDLAVLNQGDGPCWWVVRIRPNGTGDPVRQGDRCGPLLGVSFESGGATLAGIDAELPGSLRRFVVIEGTGSPLGGRAPVQGAFQTWWTESSATGPGNILVMTGRAGSSRAIIQCRVSENLCSDEPVWSGFARDTVGSSWIVEQRPAPA